MSTPRTPSPVPAPPGAALLVRAVLGTLRSGLGAGLQGRSRRNAWAATAEARARSRARRDADRALEVLAPGPAGRAPAPRSAAR